MRLLIAACLLFVGGCERTPTSSKVAHDTPAVQLALTGRVIDQAEVLPAVSETRLARRLAALESATTDQVVVVTLDSLNGASIEQVGHALGNRRGVGRADLDNGVLLLVVPSEQRVRVEVGLGLEGLLTDARSAAIVRAMLPQFASAQPHQAIESGIGEIDVLLRSDRRRPQRKPLKDAA